MKRHIIFLLVIILGNLTACSQIDYSNDSIRVVNAEWSVDSLDGFVLKRYHFGEGTLFCSPQHFFVIEVPGDSPRRLKFVCDTVLTEVSVFAERADALAAINGSYFDMDYGNPVCYLRIDGQPMGENTPAKNDSINRKYYQYAALTLRGGKPYLMVPDSNRLSEEKMKERNIMTAGPMLLWKGEEVAQRDDRSFVTRRHNRTALGKREDGSYILFVADGRFKDEAEGLTIYELQKVMRWLGCSDAINLDGGGSSTMYIKDDGVVNYPSDNRQHDHEGERPVSNAILVM